MAANTARKKRKHAAKRRKIRHNHAVRITDQATDSTSSSESSDDERHDSQEETERPKNGLRAGEDPDDDEDVHSYASHASKARLRQLLLETKPLMLEGISNARNNHRSSRHALSPHTIINGLEGRPSDRVAVPLRLLPHQRDAIGRWEYLTTKYGFVLFADDAGLGEAVAIVAVILRAVQRANQGSRKTRYPLGAAPAALARWQKEFARAPEVKVHVYTNGNDRDRDVSELEDFHVILASYGHLQSIYERSYQQRRSLIANRSAAIESKSEALLSLCFDQLILDERHAIPTPNLHEVLRSVQAAARGIITNTPVQNAFRDFSDLFQWFDYPPLNMSELFAACFPDQDRTGLFTCAKRRAFELNHCILACLRSFFTIRRLRTQEFDWQTLHGVPDWDATEFLVDLSPMPKALQESTKHIWNDELRGKRCDEARERMFKRLAPVPDEPVFLYDISRARLSANHADLPHAKYGEFSEYDLEDFEVQEATDFDSIRQNLLKNNVPLLGTAGSIQVQRSNIACENKYFQALTEQEIFNRDERRTQFLDPYRNGKNDWRSDKLFGVVELLKRLTDVRRQEASTLTGVERRKYLATSKVVVFSNYLCALDLLAVGIESKMGVKAYRYDTTQSGKTLEVVRQDFEETGKIFLDHMNQPDDVHILLATPEILADGVTLPDASDVIILNPQWNTSIEDQIIACASCDGQAQQVMVYRFVCSKSMEERVSLVQLVKRCHIRRLIEDDCILQDADEIERWSDEEYLHHVGLERAERALRRGVFAV